MGVYYQDNHVTIINGDCLEIMPGLDMIFDACITDPPYLLHQEGGAPGALGKRIKKMRDQIDFIAAGFDIQAVMDQIIRLVPSKNILTFCSNKQVAEMMQYFQDKRLATTLLAWEKTNPPPVANYTYLSDLEFCVYARGKGAFFNAKENIKLKRKLKTYPIVSAKGRMHPTQKPVALIEELVQLHTDINHVIIDPFAGSGTTGVAAINSGRKAVLIEKEEKYCEISALRCEKARRKMA
jgi:DNA modification methylase